MKCPICHAELRVTERQGIEIDYCPPCRGVWLDRGELDKMIERAPAAFSDRRSGTQGSRDDSDANWLSRSRHEGSYAPQPQKKKGSFLSELFDFG